MNVHRAFYLELWSLIQILSVLSELQREYFHLSSMVSFWYRKTTWWWNSRKPTTTLWCSSVLNVMLLLRQWKIFKPVNTHTFHRTLLFPLWYLKTGLEMSLLCPCKRHMSSQPRCWCPDACHCKVASAQHIERVTQPLGSQVSTWQSFCLFALGHELVVVIVILPGVTFLSRITSPVLSIPS